MHIQDYIDKRTIQLGKTSRQIRDANVFDFNYIPQQPLMRQETRPLIDALLRYATTGIANHLLISGSRGSGKTLMVKYIGRLLQNDHGLTFVYANCREHNTSFKILASLLEVRPRGHSMDELWQRFCDDHTGRLVLILDEIDLISDKDRTRQILYLISRSPRNYMAVLLSNNPQFLNSLDESTRSTLQPELVHFRDYNAEELHEILVDRARSGIVRPPKRILPQIAALTTKHTNSDVRVAIKTLYYLALEPRSDVREMFEKARRDIVREMLSGLNDRNLMILKVTASIDMPFVKKVYGDYRRLSQQLREEPYSYVYFYSNLSYLQSVGLILLLSTKVGRTYTNQIQLLFAAELLDAIWKARFD